MNRRTATALGLGIGAAVAAVEIARRTRSRDDTPLATLTTGSYAKVETSDGALLEVHDAGAGPLVVLPHCWGGSMDTWAPVAAALVDRGFRVVRYNHRGHGASTVVGEADVHRLGTDLLEVLEAIDARDAVIAGHSMGGMATQAFAIDYPEAARERVRGLVLVATASGGLARSPLARYGPYVVGVPALDRLMAGRRGGAIVRGAHGRRPNAAAVRATRDAFVATPPAVRRAQLRAMLEMDLRDGRASIKVPTTVVAGTRDGLTPISHSRGIAKAIPGARLVEVPGAGHMLPYEATELVTDLIAEAHQ
jgi:non-heme chloroperoxidase